LIEKVKVWASLSNGFFPIQQGQLDTEQGSYMGSAGADLGDQDMERSSFVRFSMIQEEDQVLLF
jgi:hypothetical protein